LKVLGYTKNSPQGSVCVKTERLSTKQKTDIIIIDSCTQFYKITYAKCKVPQYLWILTKFKPLSLSKITTSLNGISTQFLKNNVLLDLINEWI